jgi:uncharacterized membrane protein YcaP (DUF421 family)
MGGDLGRLSVPALELVIRAVVVYLSILILLRVAGKRQIAQMSPTEFVAILLISNAVQNAMNGGDNSLVGGLLLAAVLIGTSWAVSYLTHRSRGVAAVFEGTPTLLVHRGVVIEEHLRREHMNLHELRALLRRQGIHHFHEIHAAVLEPDGTLAVTRMEDLRTDGKEGPKPA